MIFVGYERGSKAYRAFDTLTSRVTITRDVVFDESAQWDWTGENEGGGEINHHDDMFTMQYRVLRGEREGDKLEVGNGDLEAEPRTPLVTPGVSNHTSAPGGSLVELLMGLHEEDLDADHDDTLIQLRSMNDLVGTTPPPEYVVRTLDGGDEQLHIASAEEPASVVQVTQEVPWQKAMEEELQAIEENQTWTLTELHAGWRTIGLKWVFKVKKVEHGEVVRHTVGLIVKGYAQHQGIDYWEVSSPVAHMEAVPLLLALATQEGWQVHHMDVKMAFLNGDL
jgi:hypothetical protein